jgi:hypothetical protein
MKKEKSEELKKLIGDIPGISTHAWYDRDLRLAGKRILADISFGGLRLSGEGTFIIMPGPPRVLSFFEEQLDDRDVLITNPMSPKLSVRCTGNKNPVVVISMSAIPSLEIGGDCSAFLYRINQPILSVISHGSAKIYGHGTVDRIELAASGSSTLTMTDLKACEGKAFAIDASRVSFFAKHYAVSRKAPTADIQVSGGAEFLGDETVSMPNGMHRMIAATI